MTDNINFTIQRFPRSVGVHYNNGDDDDEAACVESQSYF